jgi:hypothetical protein
MLVIAACKINPAFFNFQGGGGGAVGGGPVYRAEVQAFHRVSSNATIDYAFLPVNEQAGDLEYESYKDLARKEFAAYGWREVDRDEAEVLVAMDYLLDEGKPYTVQIPVFGRTGVSRSTTTGTVETSRFGTTSYTATTTYTPRFGITGFRTRSYEQYRRRLYVLAFDAYERIDGKPRTVFQGTAVSEGTTPHLTPVMPFLLRSLIRQIRDESGAIREYRSDQEPPKPL